jgi:O-acetyl-ADP-ribose deacetylase (regulator of RNase III)
MFKEVKGDLFEAPLKYAIGHGCNTHGVMGAGVAKEFKRRYPDEYLGYRINCDDGVFKGGEAFAQYQQLTANVDGYEIHGKGRLTFCLITQIEPGRNAQVPFIYSAVEHALSWCDWHHTSRGGAIEALAIPRLGCGIGGLEWGVVRPYLEEAAIDHFTSLVVYSLEDLKC